MVRTVTGDANIPIGSYIGIKVGGAKNVYYRKSLTSTGQYKLVCQHSTSRAPETLNIRPDQSITLYTADDIKYHQQHVCWTGERSMKATIPLSNGSPF